MVKGKAAMRPCIGPQALCPTPDRSCEPARRALLVALAKPHHSPKAAPCLLQVGGLADVLAALPQALAAR